MSTIAESPGATVAVLWAQQVSGAGTVGVIRNETLVFVNFSAQDASILKISMPIIKRRS